MKTEKKMIKKGDCVEVIDDTLSGKVVAVSAEQIMIETEDGFVFTYKPDEVIKAADFSVSRTVLEKVAAVEKAQLKKKKKRYKRPHADKPMEVDLHIEKLTSSTQNMSDYAMLNLQLDTARSQLEFAIRKHIQRIVFIHGVGKGVLRAELETLLRRYDQVEFYDAEYSKYGRGATEVSIHQNR